MFKAKVILQEIQKYKQDLYKQVSKSYLNATGDKDFLRLEEESFSKCEDISLDYAIMEKTAKAVVIKAKFDWCDIGTFSKLWDISDKNSDGNVEIGNVISEDTKACYIKSSGPLIATLGVEDLIIIGDKDVTLVANKRDDEKIKILVEKLKSENKQEAIYHKTVYKPWGFYSNLTKGNNFLVKIINISPNKKLSLQKHEHRSEHWVCVAGSGKVTIEGEVQDIHPNDYIYLPTQKSHRIENTSNIPLEIIEIQNGEIIREDDITRLEDDFNRI